MESRCVASHSPIRDLEVLGLASSSLVLPEYSTARGSALSSVIDSVEDEKERKLEGYMKSQDVSIKSRISRTFQVTCSTVEAFGHVVDVLVSDQDNTRTRSLSTSETLFPLGDGRGHIDILGSPGGYLPTPTSKTLLWTHSSL